MQSLAPSVVAPFVAGAMGFVGGDCALQPIRLPSADLELHHPSLRSPMTAESAAGIRLRMRTDARRLIIDADHDPMPLLPSPPVYDLVCEDGEVIRCPAQTRDGMPDRVEFSLPPGSGVIEIWLPQGAGVRIRSMMIDQNAVLELAPDRSPRWTVHGSSITHCAWVAGPTDTWPAIVARQLGWHLTCLGYNGGCHLDPLVARAIAARPADQITLELGINIHNLQTLRERTFAPMLHGFIQTIRDRQPDTPMTIISPIISPEREDSAISNNLVRFGGAPLEGDMTLNQMRDQMHAAVALLTRRGDMALKYIDGRSLFGIDDVAALSDGLHPEPHGYALMAERFARLYAPHSGRSE